MDALTRSDKIRAREGFGHGTAELHCPHCGGQYLHHEGVTSFDRGEDAADVRVTKISPGGVTLDSAVSETSGNPSSRRDGLIVHFSCELCEASPIQLTIAQHKGQTEIGWRYGAPSS